LNEESRKTGTETFFSCFPDFLIQKACGFSLEVTTKAGKNALTGALPTAQVCVAGGAAARRLLGRADLCRVHHGLERGGGASRGAKKNEKTAILTRQQ